MIDPHACTFVLGICNTEGEAIRHQLDACGAGNKNGEWRRLDVVPRKGTQPQPLSVLHHRDLQGFHRTVVLIGCCDPGMEEMIRATGRRVVAIDDRAMVAADGTLMDRRNSCTALEQVEALLGDRSPHLERDAIIANARGGIPALAEALWRKADPRKDPPKRAPRVDWADELGMPVDPPVEPGDRAAAVPVEAPKRPDPEWHEQHAKIAEQVWAVRKRDHERAKEALKAAAPPPQAEHVPTLEAAVEALRKQTGGVRRRVFATGRNAEREDDPELILVTAPEPFRPVLEDAIYRWMYETHGSPLTHRLEILALYESERKELALGGRARVVGVELHTDGARRPLVEALLRPDTRRELGLERLTIEISGIDAVSCRLTDALGSESRALSRLADWLLDDLLTGNRPLRAWRTSFLQPLRFRDKERFRRLRRELLREDDRLRTASGATGFKLVRPDDEERAYFLLQLRPHIVPIRDRDEIPPGEDGRDATLLSFERTDTKLSLRLTRADYDQAIAHDIVSVRLHLFAENCLVVEWTLAWEAVEDEEERRRGDPEEHRRLWRLYLERLPQAAPSLAAVLDLNRHARFVYSSYEAKEVSGNDAMKKRTLIRLMADGQVAAALNHAAGVSIRQPFEPWFRVFLQNALGAHVEPEDFEGEHIDLLSDDRARVISSVVAWGRQPTGEAGTEAFRCLRARLHMVEEYDSGWPYDPGFSETELEQGSYARFNAGGTWFGISSHSFVCLTFGDFGRKVVHGTHMACVYRRMFVLTLLHAAALQAFASDIPKSLEAWTPGERLPDAYRRLRPVFLRFTNLLWFHRVSSQVQGVELFERMQQQAGLEREYGRIQQEIADTDSYWQEESEIRREERMRALTLLGIPFAVMLALYGLRGKPGSKDGSEPTHDWWGWLLNRLGGMSDEWAAALVAVFVLVAGVVALFALRERDVITARNGIRRDATGASERGWRAGLNCLLAGLNRLLKRAFRDAVPVMLVARLATFVIVLAGLIVVSWLLAAAADGEFLAIALLLGLLAGVSYGVWLLVPARWRERVIGWRRRWQERLLAAKTGSSVESRND
ncbi:MAG: hypothetical protein IPM60_01865 [Rhodospirillales bacterium]|nr:hypothetical protein [Rhodospirillales bacterium]